MILRLLTLVLCLLAARSAWAQPAPDPLFMDLPMSAAAAAAQARQSPPSGAIVGRRAVGMRLDRLFAPVGAGQRIQLNIGDRAWIATLERIEVDANGFRSWVGAIDGVRHSHVVFTERDGTVSGLIDGIAAVYQVVTTRPGSYVIEQIDRSRLGVEHEPLARDPAAADRSGIARYDAPRAAAAADDGSAIDVLMLYTPNARTARGGTVGIQAAAAQVISDTNTAFLRSGIATRVRMVGVTEFVLPSGTEASMMGNDLQALTGSAAAQNLREQFRADLVQLLVSSPDPNSCGVAWLFRSLTDTSFTPYSVADVICLAQYTPTHEMAHNMGSQHAPEDSVTLLPMFPYSFGFKDPVHGFRTVMAYDCTPATCPRIVNFSNPNVTQNNNPTGAAGQNNARSINETMLAVANFRQAPDRVTAPAAPIDLQADVIGSTVTLRWAPDTRRLGGESAATSYTLHVGNASGLSDLLVAPLGNVTAISGVVPDGVYYWRVVATNSGGSSPPSIESRVVVGACTPPNAPQNFVYSLAGRSVTLGWTPNPTGGAPIAYIVEAGRSAGVTDIFYGDTGAPITGGSTTVAPGTYFVRVRARNACGVSAASIEQMIVVP